MRSGKAVAMRDHQVTLLCTSSTRGASGNYLRRHRAAVSRGPAGRLNWSDACAGSAVTAKPGKLPLRRDGDVRGPLHANPDQHHRAHQPAHRNGPNYRRPKLTRAVPPAAPRRRYLTLTAHAIRVQAPRLRPSTRTGWRTRSAPLRTEESELIVRRQSMRGPTRLGHHAHGALGPAQWVRPLPVHQRRAGASADIAYHPHASTDSRYTASSRPWLPSDQLGEPSVKTGLPRTYVSPTTLPDDAIIA